MSDSPRGRIWTLFERLDAVWSVVERVGRIVWIPIAGGISVTPVLNWLGIPLWQAAVFGLCITILLFISIFFTIKINRELSSVGSHTQQRTPKTSRHYALYFALICGLVFAGYTLVQLHQLREDVDCYVIPRRLSAEQSAAIAEFLLRYEPQDIHFLVQRHDEEASVYRSDFQMALKAAKWYVAGVDYGDLVAGSGVYYRETSERSYYRANKRRPTDPLYPDEILKQALQYAGVPTIRGGGGSGGLEDPEYILTLEIGPRRRDYYACEEHRNELYEQELRR